MHCSHTLLTRVQMVEAEERALVCSGLDLRAWNLRGAWLCRGSDAPLGGHACAGAPALPAVRRDHPAAGQILRHQGLLYPRTPPQVTLHAGSALQSVFQQLSPAAVRGHQIHLPCRSPTSQHSPSGADPACRRGSAPHQPGQILCHLGSLALPSGKLVGTRVCVYKLSRLGRC